ncbi:zinc finger protein 280D isoform X3 [Monodelphis domestica]|uniref:zinc finger protein 280D isoform X3 n=1 Tax=Monodelphis domestica TaxID=13616 RepID=UPI0024E1E5EC|nr:zinc finger protein 280D isoform X3 [Monodelphis domestica]XP_056665679.1 zinc finger protein 280D isoform X3 [Monodelphis domestica]XP_056665681.1 zinc finger protein 280D isoform X3 [Monodelphis domestica]XP_056665685.1 zinc finger protein 280D isoform X3 [Monodelphis domestica]XP_056665695.1 zinc finger protein 280D isoform X3 [Monodelphis domestica]XP_056665699.1 zinc finger protein 280D isoform X3 [Monodelphis domestica]
MGDNPLHPKDNLKMAELFMECEEEELEPWQKKVKEVEGDDDVDDDDDDDDVDDDDDEPIFVGEIASSKPAISNILNRVNPSSSTRGIQNGATNRGAVASFKPTSQHYMTPTSNPMAASPVFQSLSSSTVSTVAQPLSKPGHIVSSPQVVPNNSSGLLFDLRQNAGIPQYQGGPTRALTVNSVASKKPKSSEGIAGTHPSSAFSSVKSSSQSTLSKGTITSAKNGPPFPRACPKCNIHFNLLDPLKNHMKYCCPERVNNFFWGSNKTEYSSATSKNKIADADKGKLIMLVNDFYYGKHEGDNLQEQKTHTTFKCFSCLKILKNNIRFMNHMKHHLELEKQSSESWENHTTCQHCYRQFPTPFQLQCHIESTHTPHEFSTICKICELSFETEQVLLQHMKDNHKPGEMPYFCQVCNYRSSSFSDVETHFRTSHENTKNLLCPFCLKVIKLATPYMHHYMKHQKKGIYRCTKCRLQFLTCKEKMDHKTQHRTFKKPKQLEGLPPGTKVTIRASVGPLQAGASTAPSISASTSTLQLSPPRTKNTTAKSTTAKTTTAKSTTAKNSTRTTATKSKSKPKTSHGQKKPGTGSGGTKRNKVNTALRNLRFRRGVHKCIECYSEIKDFANHFPTYVHCSLCRYNTSCSKAYVNHMMSFHSARASKRFCIFKKHSEDLRGITVVCLNCDFLTDVSGIDNMAKHLSESDTHTCQIIKENTPVSISSSEQHTELKNEIIVLEKEATPEKNSRPNMSEGKTETSTSEREQENASSEKAKKECDVNQCKGSSAIKNEESTTILNMKNDPNLVAQDRGSRKSFSYVSDNSDVEEVMEKQQKNTDSKTELKMCQSSENTILNDQTNNSNEAKPSSRNTKNLKLTSNDVIFEQFLRKRDEPESISSDVSEQGSIHLEPLTPSEVLEHEATEILQKGSLEPSAEEAEVVSEQTDDISRGYSLSTTETTVDLTDEKEAS